MLNTTCTLLMRTYNPPSRERMRAREVNKCVDLIACTPREMALYVSPVRSSARSGYALRTRRTNEPNPIVNYFVTSMHHVTYAHEKRGSPKSVRLECMFYAWSFVLVLGGEMNGSEC